LRSRPGIHNLDADVVSAVTEAVRSSLVLDGRPIHGVDELRALPGFNSFRLVEIIDRIERDLGVELPAEVGADDLQDVDGLCRLFTRAIANRGQSRQ
jgi:acyl carrier protein